MQNVRRAVVTSALLTCATSSSLLAQTFTPLGGLDPKNFGSSASGVSGDGSVVVGGSLIFDPVLGGPAMHAVRWTAGQGLRDLGLVTGSGIRSTLASRTSNDGAIVTGTLGIRQPWGFEQRNAAYWSVTSSSVESHLLQAATAIGYTADDVSANGTVIVGGTRFPGPVPVPDSAYRLDVASGIFQTLGYLPGGNFSQATAVSADGSVTVGYGSTPSALSAFRHTAGGGMQPLTGGAPGVPSEAHGISADGNVIVGQYNNQAMRWTASGGFVNLGSLPEPGSTLAHDVSGDGSVIVGYNFIEPGKTLAFVWDEAHGIRNLSDALAGYGIDLDGWTLTDATGVSDDGLTLVGTGINPLGQQEGWVAHIPSPGSGITMTSAIVLAMRRRRS